MDTSRRAMLKATALGAAGLQATALGAAGALCGPVAAASGAGGLMTHRFGVNYVPSGQWYYCWNDWQPAAIAADLSRIAEIGADHVRVMLVWPWFQPNPAVLSDAHLDRLEQLMELAATQHLDVFPSLFTGWLSGYAFTPPFLGDEPFYTSARWAEAQGVLVDGVARRLSGHRNLAGIDLGNEMGCCWKAPAADGSAWLARTMAAVERQLPGLANVMGVDHTPWFHDETFYPKTLVAQQRIVALHCWPYWSGAGKRGGPLDRPYTHLVAGMAALARSLGAAPAKPIWAQEFGACAVEMPEADIPRFMDITIDQGVAQGVSWFTWWASHDVSRRYSFHPFEYGLGLIDSANRIKPQGRAFRAIADRYRGKPVRLPAKAPPPPPVERNDEATWRWLAAWMADEGHAPG